MGKNRGNWFLKDDCKKNKIKLLRLLRNGDLTSCQLRERLKVGKTTISDYLRDLESEGWIEFHIDSKNRQIRYYRIKPKTDKQLLKDFIGKVEYANVLEFLLDFTMDLIMFSHTTDIRNFEDMKAMVEKAKETTFKTLYSEK